MRILILVSFIITCQLTVKAQTAEDSVKAAVTKMFDAMRQSDSAMLQSSFSPSAVLQAFARSKEGKTIVKNETVTEFAGSISKAPKGALDERIVFETIKIDGPLAAVWTPYTFYYNGKQSHCGVNSFQLVRIDGEWKIQYILDTRRKNGCKDL
jgi:hypothetical protein